MGEHRIGLDFFQTLGTAKDPSPVRLAFRVPENGCADMDVPAWCE